MSTIVGGGAWLPANAASPLVNGGFESGTLAGWTAVNTTSSAVTVRTAFTAARGGRVFAATEGSRFAVLEGGNADVYTMLSQEFTAKAGDKIAGDAFYATGEASGTFLDDGSVAIVDAATGKVVATPFARTSVDVGFQSSPWTSWSTAVPSAGSYRIRAQIRNTRDSAVDSYLGLDNVRTADANSAPVVAVTGVTATTYEIGSVPSAGCSVTDAEDVGESAVAVTDSGALVHGLGKETVTCTYTDAGGLSDSDSVTYDVVDTGAPVSSYTLTPGTGPNADGWYASDVTVAWSCTDTGGSGIQTCADDVTVGEGSAQAPVGTAVDWAGNQATTTVSPPLNVDKTSPSITDSGTDATANAAGWHKAAVTSTFTRTDALSGLVAGTPVTEQVSTGTAEGPEVTVSSSPVSDVAGNTTDGISSAAYKIDLTAPSVALVGAPASGATVWSTHAAPTCSAGDALSGVAGTCSVTGWSTAIGSHTVTASVTDTAGNTSSTSSTYTVRDMTSTGFYAPVDMGGVYNVVKGGSTVPMKFNVLVNGAQQTSTAVVTSFTASRVTCGTGIVTDEIEFVTTGATTLRYDATAGQYVQNWKTPVGAGTCYRTSANLSDGESVTALFKLK